MTKEMDVSVFVPAGIAILACFFWCAAKYEQKTGKSFDNLMFCGTCIALTAACIIVITGIWLYCCWISVMQLFGMT